MAKSDNLVQVDLESGASRRTCFVEPKVKVGDRVTLRNSDEPERLWDVVRVGLKIPRKSIKTEWHNNI